MFARSTDTLRRAAGLLVTVSITLSATLIAACGGGGGGLTADSATAYAAGPITGFGSIIVNGIRFDDSSASVLDDDDNSHDRSELRLGMMVEVSGQGMDRAAGSAHALRIRFGSEIVGPIDSINADAGTLVVLGQTVEITPTTVFDDSIAGGLAGLAERDVIEVHAQFNAGTGHYIAKRVEAKPGATAFKLRGLVSNLDNTAKTFTIGSEVINYAGIAAADLPANLANDQRVRVRLQTTKNASNQWVAIQVRSGERRVDDHDDAEVRGTINAFTSVTEFEVNGLKVNAAGATFDDGTAGVALGAQVEVEGRVVDGVLVARKVELEGHDDGDDGDRSHNHNGFELHGLVSELNATAKTFRLRGVTVSYAGPVLFKDGSEADLANDRQVEVKGVLSTDGTQVVATEIDFE